MNKYALEIFLDKFEQLLLESFTIKSFQYFPALNNAVHIISRYTKRDNSEQILERTITENEFRTAIDNNISLHSQSHLCCSPNLKFYSTQVAH